MILRHVLNKKYVGSLRPHPLVGVALSPASSDQKSSTYLLPWSALESLVSISQKVGTLLSKKREDYKNFQEVQIGVKCSKVNAPKRKYEQILFCKLKY
jgi:hypothetical protein